MNDNELVSLLESIGYTVTLRVFDGGTSWHMTRPAGTTVILGVECPPVDVTATVYWGDDNATIIGKALTTATSL